MKRGALPPLSRKAEALLSASREIVPQPDLVRRRAQLRARTALWQERNQRDAHGVSLFWRRLSLAAAVALFATSGLAAWYTLKPETPREGPSVATQSVSKPVPPRVVAPTAEAEQPTPESGPAKDDVSATEPAKRAASPSPKPARQQARAGLPEEFTLLDQARRAVVKGNFPVALKLIERHARSYPKSELREEREALRVRALEGAGLSKKAGKAASDFESRYPRSVLAPQMNESGRTSP